MIKFRTPVPNERVKHELLGGGVKKQTMKRDS